MVVTFSGNASLTGFISFVVNLLLHPVLRVSYR